MTQDFRIIFNQLAADSIINRSELAELLCTSENAISQMAYRGELPATAFPKKRRALWFVRDIKAWLEQSRTPEPATKQSSKIGRPRSED
ncbi:helix-turn-helix transcriptional regulator [Limnobacter sp.]|uniref:helix-turn-helix transcriptional regulator n=1 Tax=Limnobacter sp. TaxID=2003368 RepID=UPI00391B8624